MGGPEEVRAFAQQLTALQGQLYVYVATLVGRPADAEDVLQDVNRAIWEEEDRYTPGTNFAAWAFRVAFYQVLTFRKRRGREQARRRELSDEVLELVAVDAGRLLENDTAEREALQRCLAKLRERDRDLLTRRYTANAEVADIARDLGWDPKSVYRALARIRTALLECVKRSLALGERS